MEEQLKAKDVLGQELSVGDVVLYCKVERSRRRLIQRIVTDVGIVRGGLYKGQPFIRCDNNLTKITNLAAVCKISNEK